MHGNSRSLSLGFTAGLLLLAAAFWFAVGMLVSLISGWHKLAVRYRFDGDFPDERWRFQSAGFRWGTRYNRVLTLGANESGMYMAVLGVFRMGHPPLFLPWNEVTATDRRRWMMEGTQFVLGRETQVPMWLFKRTADRLLSHRPAGVTGENYFRSGLEPPRPRV